MCSNAPVVTNHAPIGIISDWVYVYKQHIPNRIYQDLYTYVPDDNNNQIPITLYDVVDDNVIAIPRYCKFALDLYNYGLLNDARNSGADIDIDINVGPRDHYQQEAINSILDNDHGILCAKTAFGKTYVAINVIAKLKKRALILMHKRDLMEQWKQDIIKYTTLTENDIQIFTGTKFDEDKAITITTVQNIAAKMRNGNFDIREQFNKANFGITFMDECHTTVGPISNSMASRWIFSKRLYGLSATPKRGDGFDKVINYLLGDVIYTDNRKMMPIYTCFAPVNVPIPGNIQYWLNRSQKTYTINYNKWLKNQDTYTNHCANLIVSLIEKNRKILAVAAYKHMLDAIYEKTYSIMGDRNINVDKMCMVHGTTDLELSSIKNMTSEQIDNFNCIFSTNKFFSDGISIDWLDTIIYLTPPSSKSLSAIPQLVGRIVRDYIGKEFVIVIDVYNESSRIEVMRARNREKAYALHKYINIPITTDTTPLHVIEQVISSAKLTTLTNSNYREIQ